MQRKKKSRFGLLDLLAVGAIGTGAAVILADMAKQSSERAAREAAPGNEPQEYTVMYSSLGSDFRHPGPDPTVPQPPFKTLSHARLIATSFIVTAREIDGRAQIMNVRTGEIIQPD